jgi:polysaccharide biosynthesis transport protein
MNETTDATSIFAPLWRRKWLILAVGVLVALGSYFYYKRQPPRYESSTQVYLGASAEELAPGEKLAKTPGNSGSDQAAIINAIVVEEVRQRLKVEHRRKLIRGTKVKAKAPEKSEFITIRAEGHTAVGTSLLANLVAQTYIKRAHANHRRAIENVISISRRQLRRVEAASAASTTTTAKGKKGESTGSIIQAANLSTKINQLESTLAAQGAQQIKPAKPAGAVRISASPRKNAIFGFVIGIVLASIAAYVLSRFDRRLRSLTGIEGIFRAQILTALPKVARPIIVREGTPTPSKPLLEPLRRLHTALELGPRLEHEPQAAGRVILFISADAGDGKSTLIADLALVQRDAGARVAIVEANLRRPVQAKLLNLDGSRGLAEVIAGSVSLDDGLQRVTPIHPPDAVDAAESAENVATAVGSRAGSLFLLAGSNSVANPPAVLADSGMRELLGALAAEFDYVLIDAPSPLEFSDVMPLLSIVGGIAIVARVGHTRETAAERLVNVLANVPSAPVLGVIANCAGRTDSERYGFSAPTGRVSSRLIGR